MLNAATPPAPVPAQPATACGIENFAPSVVADVAFAKARQRVAIDVDRNDLFGTRTGFVQADCCFDRGMQMLATRVEL